LITRWTLLRFITSASGSASRMTRSASFPGASVPISPSMPMAFAPFDVAERNTCKGVSPARVMISISRNTDGPCNVPMLPASVPMTTGIPASHTLRRFCSAMAEGLGGAGWERRLGHDELGRVHGEAHSGRVGSVGSRFDDRLLRGEIVALPVDEPDLDEIGLALQFAPDERSRLVGRGDLDDGRIAQIELHAINHG